MPTSTEAAIVFLVIILPGFLAQGGYRTGRAVPEHEQGLVAVARVIAMSTLIDLVAWKLGGHTVYEHGRARTTLTLHEPHTYRFAVALFLLPPILGYITGQTVDTLARRVGDAADRLPPLPSKSHADPLGLQIRRRALGAVTPRLLNEGPTTWDKTWRKLRRSEPFAYIRITTKGGREIVGVVAQDSRVALSPQPRDIYLEQVLRPADDGNYYPTAHGLGAFVAGPEIESLEWVSHEGLISSGMNNDG